MAYTVKETYYTLQGEGAHAGRAAVFCRFTGCNLWSGLEKDRATAACRFCDTDFRGTDGPGGGRFEGAAALAEHIRERWGGAEGGRPYVVFTGGEPLLQLDVDLIEACHARSFEVAIETNGTLPVPAGVDWVCVSPKPRSELVVRTGNELKLVFPQPEFGPEVFADLDFTHFFLQPMDSPERDANTALTVAYCRAHPRWRLSLQTHKLLGIP
ncbi:MAG: 7-carboxy-7-deazaguanine synthase [Deltaproteobacteria bacterium]|nr:7-carboxy-7-deazaguanine synthase [Deltaproteobacteria bacterium]